MLKEFEIFDKNYDTYRQAIDYVRKKKNTFKSYWEAYSETTIKFSFILNEFE